MKRLLFFICTMLCANVLSAQYFWEGDLEYDVTSTNPAEVEVNGANESITIANIPSTVSYEGTNYSVTSIGNWAFRGCSSLTSVTIPNSVTSIENYAFEDCSSLTSVNIPNSVTSIGSFAFAYCYDLTSITIPNGVPSIGMWAFAYCSSLTSVNIPNSVTSIGERAFGGCSSLTSVTIPNSVTYIGEDAFYHCSSLTSVTIPNSVTSIGEEAFALCSSLTSIDIPNSVTSIGGYVFNDCSSLTSVTIPNSVTSIGNHAFGSCSSLTSITIPNSVTSIGNRAFNGCDSLTSITIPNSVTSVGDGAFGSCSSLTSVNIPNSVTSIAGFVFSNCSSLTSIDIPNSVTSIGEWAFNGCDSLTSIDIPNSVTSIGTWAFRNCSSLTSVTIPNSVTSIGYGAFGVCSSLTSITIPNSVTYIGGYAFYDCSSLTTLNYNAINCNDFDWDDDHQFYNCPITTINIGDSVQRIPNYFAYNLDSLTSVTITNSVDTIGDSAFYSCNSLDFITCLADIPPALGNNVFNNTPSNKILYVNCGLKDDYISSWGDYFNSNNIQEITFDINTYVNNEIEGSIEIERNNCSTATLTATANICYQFVSWNDGNTENPRIIELTNDTTFTAIFEELPNHNYNVNVSINNDSFGSVSIENDCNSSTLTATANNCYQFVSWNDGNTENPRVVNVSSDTSLTAIFEDFNTELSATICPGERFIGNGFNVPAGVYTQTHTAVNGCDSIVTLVVTTYPTFDTTINATINAGETYAEFGFNESEAGTYVQNLQTVNGCDSTITLILDVNSSLMDVEYSELSFYPNPTDSKITFSSTIESIEVIDQTGRCVLRFANASEINIETLPSGAYYLRLTNNDKAIMRKVIKE